MARANDPDQTTDGDTDAPRWVWDLDRLRIVAANQAALAFWRAETVADLAARRFHAESGVAAELSSLLAAAAAFRTLRTVVQLAPAGRPVSAPVELVGVRTPDGRRGLRVTHLAAGADTVRGRLLLDLAPLAVVAFDAEGRAQFRNRADLAAFPLAADTLSSRFTDPADLAALAAAASFDGVGRLETTLATDLGPRPGRVTLRRIAAPAPGGGVETLAFFEESLDHPAPRAAKAPAAVEPDAAPQKSEPAAPPIPRVARLAEAALESVAVGFALFAGEDWTLYYDNPTLAEWLGAEAADLAAAPRLVDLFPEDAAALEAAAATVAAGHAHAPQIATLRAPTAHPATPRQAPGRRVQVELRRVEPPADLAQALIGPILAATISPYDENTGDGETEAPLQEPAAAPAQNGPSSALGASDPRRALATARAIRTELTSVLGFAEALAAGAADHDANLARAYLANILEGARGMSARLSELDETLVAEARAARLRNAQRPETGNETETEAMPSAAPPPRPRTLAEAAAPLRRPAKTGRREERWIDPFRLLEALWREFADALDDAPNELPPQELSDLRVQAEAALLQDALRDALALTSEARGPDGAPPRATAAREADGGLSLSIRVETARPAETEASRARRRAAASRIRSSAVAAGLSVGFEYPEDAPGAPLRVRVIIPADRVRKASEIER